MVGGMEVRRRASLPCCVPESHLLRTEGGFAAIRKGGGENTVTKVERTFRM